MITPQQQAFVDQVFSAARRDEAETHVPAAFSTAQAILESGYGAKAPGNNLFGIKADSSWKGPTVSVRTHEIVHGERVGEVDEFRAYSNYQESINDHSKFLISNERYRAAFATQDPVQFAQMVAKAGYSTNPNYFTLICDVMQSRRLI